MGETLTLIIGVDSMTMGSRNRYSLFFLVAVAVFLVTAGIANSESNAVFDVDSNIIQVFDAAGRDLPVRDADGQILVEVDATEAADESAPVDSSNGGLIEEISVEDPETGQLVAPDGSITEPGGAVVSQASEVGNSDALSLDSERITIDSMTTRTFSRYYVGGTIYLLGGARVYTLSDGSSWNSGAGSYYNYSAAIRSVETEGEIVRYVLDTPESGFLIYQQTDYNSGDHSAQGTLAAVGPLVLEASIGSTTAVIHGQAEIVANDATWYGEPRFNFYSAPVGSVVPFELIYSLDSGTWGPDTFDGSFSYTNSGSVDFAHPTSVPQLIDLELRGPGQVREASTYQYSTFAHFDVGPPWEVTNSTEWFVEPTALASIDQGTLITQEISESEALLTIRAAYQQGEVRLEVSKEVIVKSRSAPDDDPAFWETYQGDAQHDGYVPMLTDPEDFTLRWQRQVGSGRPLNPVTAADGKVFVSVLIYFNDEPTFFVLDARDGETLWSKSFGRVFSVNPPAYGYGNVYLQTGNHGSDTWLRAYDANTGAEVFSAPHSAQWERYYAPTIFDGKVYINGGYYGGMYGFDAFSGKQEWFVGLSQYDDWTPAVDEKYAYAYVGDYQPGLYVVDRITGERAFDIPDDNFQWNGWSMNLAPVLGTMNDIVAIHDGRLISFDLEARIIRWEIQSNFAGQPSIADGMIYAIDGGQLVARNEASGQVVWSWAPPVGKLLGSMIVTNSHIFAKTDQNTYAVGILSRAEDWSYPASGDLALGNDTLYIAGNDGTLTAISIPELLPVAPVRLTISGKSVVVENSIEQYRAIVEYEDGRIRDRTLTAEWSLTPTTSAEIDSRGFLSVGELFAPSETVTLNAIYTENAATVRAELEVELVIGVSLEDFVNRNLTESLVIKKRIARDFDEMILREKAAEAVLDRMSAGESGYYYRRALMSLRHTIYWDEFSRIGIDRSRAACENTIIEFERGPATPPIGQPAHTIRR